jgi:hypothetical protein
LGTLSRYYNPKESLEKASREVMAHLVHINAIIAFLDLTILDLEYSGLYDIQTTYKALVYRVKLKLEFSILSRRVDFTKNSSIASQSSERGLFKWTHLILEGKRRQTKETGRELDTRHTSIRPELKILMEGMKSSKPNSWS